MAPAVVQNKMTSALGRPAGNVLNSEAAGTKNLVLKQDGHLLEKSTRFDVKEFRNGL
jgi:catalase